MLELCLSNLKYFTDVREDKEQDKLETFTSFLTCSQQQWKLEPRETKQHNPGVRGATFSPVTSAGKQQEGQLCLS